MKTLFTLVSLVLVSSNFVFAQTNTNLGTSAGNSGSNNTSIGYRAGDQVTGAKNSFLGSYAGYNTSSGDDNTLIGHSSGYSNSGSYNTFLGSNTGVVNSGSNNTYIGYYTGNLSYGSSNTYIGYSAGSGNQAGSNNIFIGKDAGKSTTVSDKLFIENSSASVPLIYGDFLTDKVGINSLPNSTHTLTVGGTIHSTGLYVNGVLVSGDISLWDRNGSNVYTLSTSDNIGIGTTLANNPNNYKLAVNGKIGAKEVQIENTSLTWPDFVFKADYKLLSLSEVEAFIRANGHLPEIPSEQQVATEGFKVAELNTKLLQKIEELTLYVIELKKEIDALKNK